MWNNLDTAGPSPQGPSSLPGEFTYFPSGSVLLLASHNQGQVTSEERTAANRRA